MSHDGNKFTLVCTRRVTSFVYVRSKVRSQPTWNRVVPKSENQNQSFKFKDASDLKAALEGPVKKEFETKRQALIGTPMGMFYWGFI